VSESVDQGRITLFKALVVIGCILMLISFLMPWWIADVGSGRSVQVYGWGIRQNLDQLNTFFPDQTPIYKSVLAWVYLAASIGLAMASIWLKWKIGKWLLGGIGLIYIAYAATAIFVIVNNRIADLPRQIALLGTVTFGSTGFGGQVTVHTSLQPGYYIAFASGLVFIVLALLYSLFLEKSKLDSNG
jgi:hypothetical protein